MPPAPPSHPDPHHVGDSEQHSGWSADTSDGTPVPPMVRRSLRTERAGTGDGADAGAGDGEVLDPAVARGIIAAQQARVRHTAYTDDRLILGVWAGAWGIGYGVLWATARHGAPPGWAWGLFGVLIAGAVVTTIVHSTRRMSGLAGVSRRAGRYYGWSWPVAFTAAQVLIAGVASTGLPGSTVTLLANAVSALIVAVLYMAGGALWQDRAQYVLGVWMALVAGAATLAGLPGTFAVMALAGGGGMAVGALVVQARGRRRG